MDFSITNMFNSIYKNKTVLVTGHTGFKGGWLSTWLILLGAKLIGLSLLPITNPNLYDSISLDDRMISIIGDIRDEKIVNDVIQQYEPEFIFHLASQALVKTSYENPTDTYSTNLLGLVNLLEAGRRCKKTRVILNITSDKCYENKEWSHAYRENDEMGGFDPYSASKGCAELITSSYQRSFFNDPKNANLASVRAGNVIGGGDWSEDRLVPDCVRSIINNKDISLRNASATRPWQHVLEPLSGYLLVGSKMYNSDKYNSGWNFGPSSNLDITVHELTQSIIETWDKTDITVKNEANSSDVFHEANYLRLDISKAVRILKWLPILEINETLSMTIQWYKNYYQNDQDMYEFTVQQIIDYVKQASSNKYLWNY